MKRLIHAVLAAAIAAAPVAPVFAQEAAPHFRFGNVSAGASDGDPAALRFTSGSQLPSGAVVGQSIAIPFASDGGVDPHSLSSSGLPGGLGLNQTGPKAWSLSGTLDTASTYAASLTLTDADTGAVTYDLGAIIVSPAGNGPLAFAQTADLPSQMTASTAATGTLRATAGMPPYAMTLVGGPPGIGLVPAAGGVGNVDWTLVGNPTAPGVYSDVRVVLTDFANSSVTHSMGSVTVTAVAGELAFLQVTDLPGTMAIGSAVSGGFAAAGGTPAYDMTSMNFPNGVTLNRTGASTWELAGSPTAAGVWPEPRVILTDSLGAPVITHVMPSVTVGAPTAPLAFSSTLVIPDGVQFSDIWVNDTLTPTGGQPPYSVTVENLPAGFHLERHRDWSQALSWRVQGVRLEVGVYPNVRLEVRDALGALAVHTVPTFEVTAPPPPEPMSFAWVSDLPDVMQHQEIDAFYPSFRVQGGVKPYMFTVEDGPANLYMVDDSWDGSFNDSYMDGSISTAGVVSGAKVVATDAVGQSVTHTLADFEVLARPSTLAITQVGSFANGTVTPLTYQYSSAFRVEGGTGPYYVSMTNQPNDMYASDSGYMSPPAKVDDNTFFVLTDGEGRPGTYGNVWFKVTDQNFHVATVRVPTFTIPSSPLTIVSQLSSDVQPVYVNPTHGVFVEGRVAGGSGNYVAQVVSGDYPEDYHLDIDGAEGWNPGNVMFWTYQTASRSYADIVVRVTDVMTGQSVNFAPFTLNITGSEVGSCTGPELFARSGETDSGQITFIGGSGPFSVSFSSVDPLLNFQAGVINSSSSLRSIPVSIAPTGAAYSVVTATITGSGSSCQATLQLSGQGYDGHIVNRLIYRTVWPEMHGTSTWYHDDAIGNLVMHAGVSAVVPAFDANPGMPWVAGIAYYVPYTGQDCCYTVRISGNLPPGYTYRDNYPGQGYGWVAIRYDERFAPAPGEYQFRVSMRGNGSTWYSPMMNVTVLP